MASTIKLNQKDGRMLPMLLYRAMGVIPTIARPGRNKAAVIRVPSVAVPLHSLSYSSREEFDRFRKRVSIEPYVLLDSE